MHSIVTTFREAVIKVEVANFGAAMDTLIDQDEITPKIQSIVPDIIAELSWNFHQNTLEQWLDSQLGSQHSDLNHHQNLSTFSFYHPGHLHEISSQSVHNFSSNVSNITNKQEDNKRYQKHDLVKENNETCSDSAWILMLWHDIYSHDEQQEPFLFTFHNVEPP